MKRLVIFFTIIIIFVIEIALMIYLFILRDLANIGELLVKSSACTIFSPMNIFCFCILHITKVSSYPATFQNILRKFCKQWLKRFFAPSNLSFDHWKISNNLMPNQIEKFKWIRSLSLISQCIKSTKVVILYFHQSSYLILF